MGRKKTSASGIYIVHNKKNDKAYICASSNVQRAISQLKYMLRNDKCPNNALQEDWNYYGSETFEFKLLEKCFEPDFYPYKKKWIEHYQATNELYGYNNPDYTYVTMSMDSITKQTIGETQKERWKERNDNINN